jgi:photosystem II stability/assembly factor-like uncharacterized protein
MNTVNKWVQILAVATIAMAGCKKDLLPAASVQRLTSNTTDRLNKIHFADNQRVFVAGGDMFDRATVLSSTDGGYTWTANSYPAAGKAMYGLGASSTGAIYMCGVDGTVLHTADTGTTWHVGRILDWRHYVGAAFPTPDTGLFISTVLQREGCITQVDTAFRIISQDTFLLGFNSVYVTNSSTAYVLGYGAILRSTDHRRTWQYLDIKGDNFTAMHINGSKMWVCGANGSVFYTADAGNTWQRLRNGNSLAIPRYMLRDILFTDDNNGWAVGDKGTLIYSNDGGHHWMEYASFTTSALRSIALCPNGDLLIAGDAGDLFRLRR